MKFGGIIMKEKNDNFGFCSNLNNLLYSFILHSISCFQLHHEPSHSTCQRILLECQQELQQQQPSFHHSAIHPLIIFHTASRQKCIFLHKLQVFLLQFPLFHTSKAI